MKFHPFFFVFFFAKKTLWYRYPPTDGGGFQRHFFDVCDDGDSTKWRDARAFWRVRMCDRVRLGARPDEY